MQSPSENITYEALESASVRFRILLFRKPRSSCQTCRYSQSAIHELPDHSPDPGTGTVVRDRHTEVGLRLPQIAGEHGTKSIFGVVGREYDLDRATGRQVAHDAGGGIRTRTGLSPQGILSPLRLPFRHPGQSPDPDLAAFRSPRVSARDARPLRNRHGPG